jgi:exonuclease-1
VFKLDRTGACEEVLSQEFAAIPGFPLAGFTHDMFLQMCVLAGCDFLAGLPGIGVRKAHGYVRKYRGFVKLLRVLRFSGVAVPPGYEAKFQRALWAFRHCRVYCPAARRMVHLTPLPGGGIGGADVEVPEAVPASEEERAALEFLGPLLPDDVARGIAEGAWCGLVRWGWFGG